LMAVFPNAQEIQTSGFLLWNDVIVFSIIIILCNKFKFLLKNKY
jgi:hypothetical protein